MSAIFISYRREDAEDSARALYESLLREFGKERLFMDVEAIALGSDFRQAVEDSLDNCGVFVAVIGPAWVDAKLPNDASGRRRLDHPDDYVRQEVATALKRGSKLPVIPVLVRNAAMPTPEQLPDDLKDLAYRNALTLSHLDWDGNLQKLVNAIRPRVGETSQEHAAAPPAVSARQAASPASSPGENSPSPAAAKSSSQAVLLGILVLLIAAVGAFFAFRPGSPSQKLTVTILAPAFSAPYFSIDGQNVPLQGSDTQLQLAPGRHEFVFPKTGCKGTFNVGPGKTRFLPQSHGPSECGLAPASR